MPDGAQQPQELSASDGAILLQNSFSSEDSMFLMKVRQIVQQHLSKPCNLWRQYQMCDLVDPSVCDSSWYDDWLGHFIRAHGVIIVKSKLYLAKVKKRGSATWREAQHIMFRLRLEPSFRVYVLDPDMVNLGPNDLRCWLQDDKKEMNKNGWLKNLRKLGVVDIAPQTVSNYLAASVNGGLVETKPAFERIAEHLRVVHPMDAVLLLGKADALACEKVSRLCEEELVRSFMQINAADLAKIKDHEKLVRVFDSDMLHADEDDVFAKMITYLNSTERQHLTQQQVESLWATCRFAFLSHDSYIAASNMSGIPVQWISLAFARSKCTSDEQLQVFLQQQEGIHGECVRRLQHRIATASDAELPSQETAADAGADVDKLDSEYVESMLGLTIQVTQNGSAVQASGPGFGRQQGSITGDTLSMFGMTGVLIMQEIRWGNGAVWKPRDWLFEINHEDHWSVIMEQRFREKGLTSAEGIAVEDSAGSRCDLEVVDGAPRLGTVLQHEDFPLTFRRVLRQPSHEPEEEQPAEGIAQDVSSVEGLKPFSCTVKSDSVQVRGGCQDILSTVLPSRSGKYKVSFRFVVHGLPETTNYKGLNHFWSYAYLKFGDSTLRNLSTYHWRVSPTDSYGSQVSDVALVEASSGTTDFRLRLEVNPNGDGYAVMMKDAFLVVQEIFDEQVSPSLPSTGLKPLSRSVSSDSVQVRGPCKDILSTILPSRAGKYMVSFRFLIHGLPETTSYKSNNHFWCYAYLKFGDATLRDMSTYYWRVSPNDNYGSLLSDVAVVEVSSETTDFRLRLEVNPNGDSYAVMAKDVFLVVQEILDEQVSPLLPSTGFTPFSCTANSGSVQVRGACKDVLSTVLPLRAGKYMVSFRFSINGLPEMNNTSNNHFWCYAYLKFGDATVRTMSTYHWRVNPTDQHGSHVSDVAVVEASSGTADFRLRLEVNPNGDSYAVMMKDCFLVVEEIFD